VDSSFLFILAAAAKKKAEQQPGHWPVGLPDHWPGQMDLLTWCQSMGPGEACILVVAGIIYLLFGYAIFKALVTLNAMAAGAYLGALLGRSADSIAGGAFIGAVGAAAITYPLLKYAVTFMGGVFGAALGASLWRQANLQPELAWAGALSGLIFFGMLSMVIFRGSVIVYTSLQGSVMLVFGIIGLIYKYQTLAPDLTAMLNQRNFLLPAAVMLPTIVGLLFQQQMYPAEAPPSGSKKS
jgi:hypothetical protein